MSRDPYQLCLVLLHFTVAYIEPSHLDGNLSLVCSMEKIGQLTVKEKKKVKSPAYPLHL